MWKFPLHLHCTLPFISCYSHFAPFTGFLAVHMTCQAHDHLNTFLLLLLPMPQMIPLNRYRVYSLPASGRPPWTGVALCNPTSYPWLCNTLFPTLFFPMALITFWLTTGDPCTTRGLGAVRTPYSPKSTYSFWFYSQPFAYADLTNHEWKTVFSICGWEFENTVFDLRLGELVDAKPSDTKGWLYLLKKSVYKWIPKFKSMLYKDQLYVFYLLAFCCLLQLYSHKDGDF